MKPVNCFFYTIFFIVFVIFLSTASPLKCEFYEYVDELGVRNYTDDKSLIPERHRPKTTTHKEKYYHLDEAQRKKKLQQDADRIDALNRKVRSDLQQIEREEQVERDRQKRIERRNKLKNLRMPVKIVRNSILVPVSITYSGKEITTTLVLDTGASMTAVNQSVARQLNITQGERSAARVVGGGIIRTLTVTVDRIKVGPKTINKPRITVFRHKGSNSEEQGLLGLDFLQHFDYNIDYDNNLIIWKE